MSSRAVRWGADHVQSRSIGATSTDKIGNVASAAAAVSNASDLSGRHTSCA